MDIILNTTFCNYFIDKPIIRAYLFGSYARNEQTDESDIDLMVELDESKKVDIFDFIGWKLDLEELLHHKVDLLTTTGISPHIKPYAFTDRKMIYERCL